MHSELRGIAYVSRATVSANSVDAVSIDYDARRNNPRYGITGYLHREDDIYIQYIEGPREYIGTLLANLRRDWRHSHVTVRLDETIHERSFGSWGMAFSDQGMRRFGGRSPAQILQPDLWSADRADLLHFLHLAAQVMTEEGLAKWVSVPGLPPEQPRP